MPPRSAPRGYVATLYDARGQPVQPATVKREHSAPERGGIRTPYRSGQAARLTPSRLGALFRDADDGNTQAYFTLAEEVEERDMHYRSVLSTRKLGVSGVEVMVEAASDGARDQRVADDVRSTIVAEPAFEGLVTDLLDGISKGISIVEILWETSSSEWRPARYEWRDQRWFVWDLDGLSRPLLVTTANPMGEDLPAFKYAVHTPKLKSGIPIRGGLARTACGGLLLKSFSLRDWAAFSEAFGMPIRVGKYSSSTTPEERARLLDAVLAIGTDGAATMHESTLIEFVTARSTPGGEKLFQGAADWWNGELSKLVLGQTMTTESGSSLSQARVHENTRLLIRQADARAVAATINRDVIAPYVALNYGPTVRPPKVRFVIEEPEDLVGYMTALEKFVNLGGKVSASVVRDKLGLPDPTEDEELLTASAPSSTPSRDQGAGPASAGSPGADS